MIGFLEPNYLEGQSLSLEVGRRPEGYKKIDLSKRGSLPPRRDTLKWSPRRPKAIMIELHGIERDRVEKVEPAAPIHEYF